MVDDDPDFDDDPEPEDEETPEEDVLPRTPDRRRRTREEIREDGYVPRPLPDEPWGVPEEELYAELVDNGAPRKSAWWQYYYRKDDDVQVCGAHVMGGDPETSVAPPEIIAMNQGRRCKVSWNLGSNGRCRRHGGFSEFNGTLVDGRMSQVVGSLKQAADRATRQADIFDLKKFLLLFDIRLENLSWRQADENGATPEQWKTAKYHYSEAGKAKKEGDKPRASHHWKELGLILGSGQRYDEYWDKILALAERRLQRTEAAQGLMIKSAQMIAARDVRVFMHKVLNILEDEAPAAVTQAVTQRVSSELMARMSTGEEEEAPEQGALLP